jgi:hypothetical protein
MLINKKLLKNSLYEFIDKKKLIKLNKKISFYDFVLLNILIFEYLNI